MCVSACVWRRWSEVCFSLKRLCWTDETQAVPVLVPQIWLECMRCVCVWVCVCACVRTPTGLSPVAVVHVPPNPILPFVFLCSPPISRSITVSQPFSVKWMMAACLTSHPTNECVRSGECSCALARVCEWWSSGGGSISAWARRRNAACPLFVVSHEQKGRESEKYFWSHIAWKRTMKFVLCILPILFWGAVSGHLHPGLPRCFGWGHWWDTQKVKTCFFLWWGFHLYGLHGSQNKAIMIMFVYYRVYSGKKKQKHFAMRKSRLLLQK